MAGRGSGDVASPPRRARDLRSGLQPLGGHLREGRQDVLRDARDGRRTSPRTRRSRDPLARGRRRSGRVPLAVAGRPACRLQASHSRLLRTGHLAALGPRPPAPDAATPWRRPGTWTIRPSGWTIRPSCTRFPARPNRARSWTNGACPPMAGGPRSCSCRAPPPPVSRAGRPDFTGARAFRGSGARQDGRERSQLPHQVIEPRQVARRQARLLAGPPGAYLRQRPRALHPARGRPNGPSCLRRPAALAARDRSPELSRRQPQPPGHSPSHAVALRRRRRERGLRLLDQARHPGNRRTRGTSRGRYGRRRRRINQ